MADKLPKKSGQGPFIDPLTDVGFKKIFSRESNKDLLIKFLNAIFRGRKTIVDLTYGKNEHVGEGKDEAGVIFDLYCTGDKGEYFIIEMQRAQQEFFKERSVVYTSRQISSQAPKGRMKIWNYNLKEVYLVALLDTFTMPNSVSEHYIHDICLMDRETKEVFYEKLGYIYIELINFVKTEEELETDLDDWLYSLRHLSKLKKLPRVLNKPVFKRLFNIAEYNNLTDEERMLYDTELQKRWDNQNAMDFKLKQGLEQGRREERAKADQEITKLKARADKAEADKLKAEADKLETARSIKELCVLSNHQIAEKFHLPLEVVEKL